MRICSWYIYMMRAASVKFYCYYLDVFLFLFLFFIQKKRYVRSVGRQAGRQVVKRACTNNIYSQVPSYERMITGKIVVYNCHRDGHGT